MDLGVTVGRLQIHNSLVTERKKMRSPRRFFFLPQCARGALVVQAIVLQERVLREDILAA